MTKILTEKIKECALELMKKEKELGLQNDEHNRAMNVFFSSYYTHRINYGSIQHLQGKEYQNKMCERYDFMTDEAIKYLEDLVSRQRKRTLEVENDL